MTLGWSTKAHRPGWRIYANHLGDYMQRFILQTPWGDLRLHHIRRSDEAHAVHDHPWDFASLLLTGGYFEALPDDPSEPGGWSHLVWRPRFTVVRHRAEDAHRVVLRPGRTVWTLCVTGPRRRSWGFWTPTGWLPWRTARELWADQGDTTSAQILETKGTA